MRILRAVLPYHIEASRHWTLGSWDRTQIPRPFADVVLVIGPPLEVPSTDREMLEAKREELTRSLHTLEMRALTILKAEIDSRT